LTFPHPITPYVPLFDWVVAMEVAEHIPRRFESMFLDTLDNHARSGIVISWALGGGPENEKYLKAGKEEKYHVNGHSNAQGIFYCCLLCFIYY